jgi:hypothetical protein
MTAFKNRQQKSGFTMTLWRGERMCLLGFDVDQPEPDLVGFAIESKEPGTSAFKTLNNRLTFSSNAPVTGARIYPSLEAPFQKFRWIHFPFNPRAGDYTYRATKMHMPSDGVLKAGTKIELDISLDPITYDGFLDVGFTRNFASSQAFVDRIKASGNIEKIGKTIIPSDGDEGLEFKKLKGSIYQWMGFEAYDLLFGFLNEAVNDPTISVDVFAYDFNEPDILTRLEKLKSRLRIIIDDSSKKDKKTGEVTGHAAADSPESQVAQRLRATAGTANVKRTHFKNLQHHKVFIAKRNGKPFKVLAGSTNFTYRGLYIQANNALVFHHSGVAALFGQVFDAAFADPAAFAKSDLAAKWHVVSPSGQPAVHFCFSPHKDSALSLNPLAGSVEQASSSVLYAIAFLNQIKSGPTFDAFKNLMTRPVFSYGVSDKSGGLELKKPDGSIGLVDFQFLAKVAPEPFKTEWSGGKGINIHHKFVVTDFSLPTAKVFTGSSNHSPSGETGNGDHLIMIEDRKIATGYAIEAIRMFDHLHFRSIMQEVSEKPKPLTLKKPTAISGKPAWFEPYYVPNTQKERDRKLFVSD